MGYSVMLRYNNESESLYRLKIKPNNPETFISKLNQKWHDAGKIKLDAYNSMKAYCEMTKDQAACASLESFEKEISSPKASVSYNLIFYNDNSGEIENINLNHSYDLTNKDSLLNNPIEILNNFKISRTNFEKITRVELKTKTII